METETQLAEREKKLLSERELKARGVFFFGETDIRFRRIYNLRLMWLSWFCLP
jgi:hypothetical protein